MNRRRWAALVSCELAVAALVACSASGDAGPIATESDESNTTPSVKVPPGADAPKNGEAGTDAAADATKDAGKPDAANDAVADAPNDASKDAAKEASVPWDAGPNSIVFVHTGADQTWTVPAGVTSIAVKLWGAAGGATHGAASAGNGGFVTFGALAVTPGETLTIVVGGGGNVNPGLAAGGFGGGGNGSNHPSYAWSGAGGGRSAILRGATELVTAGGGGGTGYPTASGAGGAGCGGASTTDGQAGGDATGGGGGNGGGGQLVSGGTAGIGAQIGSAGLQRQGGHGLGGSSQCSGGGGGGYWGGGSGGHTFGSISGAGGGGSCFGPLGTTFDGAGGTTDPDFDGNAGRPVKWARGNHGAIVVRW